MYQESKPRIVIPPWLNSAREKAIVLVVTSALVFGLVYIVPGPFSRVLVQLGNTAFSAGHDYLGIASYALARLSNRDLKDSLEECLTCDHQRQFELAINSCTNAVTIDPDYAAAYSYRGVAYASLNKYDQAIADFTRDLELIPIATRSLINRGLVYMFQKRYDLAISDFTKSIEINPEEPQAYMNRGLSHVMLGETKPAVLDCQKAVALEERYWNAYVCLGLAYSGEQEWAMALTNFDRAIALAPSTQRSYIYCMQGSAYATFGDLESAVRTLEQGVSLDIAGQNDWCKSALENAQQGVPAP